MRWLVGNSLKFRFIVVAIAAALMYFGTGQIRDLPVDVFPEFAPPRVEVQTIGVGLTATDVEALVTVPLEDALNGLDGVTTIRSKSVPDLSSILVFFETGTDVMHARQLVSERLETVTQTLPTWVSPPFMIQPLSSTSRVMKIGVSSKERNTMGLSMTAYWKIRARLLRVPGVANVPIWGERLQMLVVRVDPERMTENQVSLNRVMSVSADALDSGLLHFTEGGAVMGTGGFVDTSDRQRLNIRHVLPIISPEDLGKVVISEESGQILRLNDVADVVEDHQPLIGDAVINDGEGLLLIVEKFPWANTLDVTRGVEAAIAELQPGLPGVEIDTAIFRPATFIELSIENLTRALFIGAILVIVVLLLFLFEWRVALITVVAIPLSLMGAGMILYLMGASINTMVLAGFVIALGAVVDDAIIDVENIMRRLRQNRLEGTQKSIAAIILDASMEVRSAILFATLIIVAALIPVFFLEGLSGAFFRPLALSYSLSVLASMVVALTVTPALSLILLRNAPLARRESPVTRWLQTGYNVLLSRIIRNPLFAYGTVGIIVIGAIAVTPFLGQSLLPSFKERDFLMHWVTRPGTSHPEMQRITTQASRELRAIPGVRNFGAHIGQAFLMDEVVGVNFGENWISISPDVAYDATHDAIQETVDGYPGLRRDVQTYLKERIKEVLTGSSDSVVVRIYGSDLETLRSKAADVQEALQDVEGLRDLHTELHVEIPQVKVEVDLEAARSHGLKPGDVRRAAATLMAGEEVGDIYRGGRAYDVWVWSTPETRQSLTSFQQLLIDTPDGGQVQLQDVADVRIVPAPNVVERENASRKIDVSANVSGRDLGAVVRDVEDRLDEVDFPLGYRADLKGEFAERQAAQNRLLLFAMGALVVIFILLQTSFGSWRLAILIFLTLPMALVGGLLAARLGGGIISLGSLVGFLTILGIAARNGIMMINHFQHLEQREGEPFGPALVLRGARERLAPILMTATTTGLALLPLVVAGDLPGHEIEHPMAVVILGGLVTSTLLNLLVVPSLYLRFAGGRSPATGQAIASPA
ncbi:MAG TPA: efflux RND transporter permease subunit [Dehalococcoidia bacterium]|nr:efflux RND transporter permease subunit [Dehalococcoidia bacterium]